MLIIAQSSYFFKCHSCLFLQIIDPHLVALVYVFFYYQQLFSNDIIVCVLHKITIVNFQQSPLKYGKLNL